MDWQLILTACAVAALVIMLIDTVLLRPRRQRRLGCPICDGTGWRVIIGCTGYRSVKCDHNLAARKDAK